MGTATCRYGRGWLDPPYKVESVRSMQIHPAGVPASRQLVREQQVSTAANRVERQPIEQGAASGSL